MTAPVADPADDSLAHRCCASGRPTKLVRNGRPRRHHPGTAGSVGGRVAEKLSAMKYGHFFRAMLEFAQRLLQGLLKACRRLGATSNLGWIVVLILAGMTIASFAWGFALQPTKNTPAEVPNPPVLNLSFQLGRPSNLSVYSFLKQANSQRTELVMDAVGSFASSQRTTRWTLSVLGFTGYLCTKQAAAARLIPMPGLSRDYEVDGHSRIPTTNGRPFLVISLCWNNGSPLITNGAYISAALSPILVAAGQSGTVTRSLVLSGTSLSSYSLAGGIAPTETTARSWVWTDNLSGSFQSQARAEIPIIASSLPGIQRDNRDIFFSGILLGIAGGALVSIVPALLSAFDRRNPEEKHGGPAVAAHPGDPSQASAAHQARLNRQITPGTRSP